MSDIFREVDEALQKEKASKFWKEYGPTLILAAFILVGSTAATTAYLTWDSWRNHQETAKLISAMEAKDIVPALEKAAEETRGGHEAVALMTAAAKEADSKNFTKAAELYNKVVDDRSAPSYLSDLATILGTRATLLTEAGKTTDIKPMADKLEKIAKNKSSAFRIQAKVEAALLYGDGLNDYTKASALLDGIENERAPASLMEKARALQQVYRSEAPAEIAPAAAENTKTTDQQ